MTWTSEGLRAAVGALWKDVRAHGAVAAGVAAGSMVIELLLRTVGL